MCEHRTIQRDCCDLLVDKLFYFVAIVTFSNMTILIGKK